MVVSHPCPPRVSSRIPGRTEPYRDRSDPSLQTSSRLSFAVSAPLRQVFHHGRDDAWLKGVTIPAQCGCELSAWQISLSSPESKSTLYTTNGAGASLVAITATPSTQHCLPPRVPHVTTNLTSMAL